VTQDVFISASAHSGVQPWDPFVWDCILALSQRIQPKGAHFVDVGANIGYFTLMAASLGYTVTSFEPMSRNARKLMHSVERNSSFSDQVKVYQNAVGEIDNQRVLMRETDASNQGNGQISEELPPPGGVYGVDFVDTVTLSNVLLFSPQEPINAYIVKVDVEGLEASVLAGASDWICARSVHHILIEFSEATRRRTKESSEMFAFMQRAGYTVSDVDITSNKANLDYTKLIAGDFDGVPPNLLFTLREGARDNHSDGCSKILD
jgi:FkbM family methyltransferase